VIERRLRNARAEIEHFTAYQYLVRNDELERAYRELRAVYVAEHLRRERQEAAALALLEESRRYGGDA
jgi:guanylate kinase